MRATNKKPNLAIWKIDDSFLAGTTPSKFVAEFQKDANKGLAEGSPQRLREVKLSDEKIAELEVVYFKLMQRRRASSGWYEFMRPILADSYEKDTSTGYGAGIFASDKVDLVLFIGLAADKLYCVTAGAGYFLIEQYIDDMYSFDVVRHMFVGDVKEARSRAITGQKFAESISYRSEYGINSSEAFGKVWKQLRGPLDKDFIKSRSVLSALIDTGRNPQAEAKASFTLKKSLSIQELVTFIKELDAIAVLPLPADKKRAFRFLDMARPVKNIALKGELRDRLFEVIFKDIKDSTGECGQFDFCHPQNVAEFFGADKHTFQVGHAHRFEFDLSGSEVPRSDNIIDSLRTVDELRTEQELFKKVFSKISYRVKPDEDEAWTPLATPLWQYFHGEIQYKGSTYFLIDKVWYAAKDSFLVALKDYFRETLEDSDTIQSSIPFNQYPAKKSGGTRDNRENRFNHNQADTTDGFWYGDMQYAHYGRAKVELFDLLYDSGDKTYVIQTKENFGGTMRDACSQIKMSAQAIYDDLRNNRKMLKAYYKGWTAAGHNKGLSRPDFLKLFEKKRLVFVIAVATKHDLTMGNLLDDKKFRSHIAKFETEAVIREFRGNSWPFEIQRITDNAV